MIYRMKTGKGGNGQSSGGSGSSSGGSGSGGGSRSGGNRDWGKKGGPPPSSDRTGKKTGKK